MIPMQWAMRRRMMMAARGGVDVANMLIQGSCTFTDYGVVTMGNGNDYRLLAITQSGNLVLTEPVNIEVCVVGGGANGSLFVNGGNGGAGAYMKNQVIEAFEGGAVVVGAAQGASSIGGVSVSAVSGKNGGTGAGAGGENYLNPGTGDGISKYPFGDETYQLWAGKPHCGAGGGGGYGTIDEDGWWDKYHGGAGGTNGGNGYQGTKESGGPYGSYNGHGGSGGVYGGGRGGDMIENTQTAAGANATYYGSGAGGNGYSGYVTPPPAGSGYQGIVYVRIPVNQ